MFGSQCTCDELEVGKSTDVFCYGFGLFHILLPYVLSVDFSRKQQRPSVGKWHQRSPLYMSLGVATGWLSQFPLTVECFACCYRGSAPFTFGNSQCIYVHIFTQAHFQKLSYNYFKALLYMIPFSL